jgi:hypothetical protein
MILLFPIRTKAARGFALVVVLAFVVLLTGLVVAFMSRATADRQMASGSSNQSSADELARSGLDVIVGDFKQEIVSGSTAGSAPDVYAPSTASNIVPVRNGNPPSVPNLIRRSIRSDTIAAPAIASRASSVNSVDASTSGRLVSLSRWNSHFLIPKADLTDDQPEPIASFVPPDWVLVSRNGPSARTGLGSGSTALTNSAATNADYVIGRYAYAVYDEGGLLDMNVAGFPVPVGPPANYDIDVGRKGVASFADLTALPTNVNTFATTTVINRMVGWRNYATIQPVGIFPALTNTSAGATAFLTYFLNRTQDFRATAATITGAGATRRTDQAFLSRSELVQLRSSSGSGRAAMLQYLGTFSRSLNRPTWGSSATRLAARFPLERFDLFTSPTTNGTAIRQYFGLVYVPAAAIPEHWQYYGVTGTTMRSSIDPLIGNSQDPDLAVLLKYAMPASPDSEILSIIASLIDQRDTDVDTTWIEFSATDPTLPTQRAYGVDRTASTEPGAPPPPTPVTVLNRSFRSVGELGYAYRDGTTSLNFQNSANAETALLDLFTYNTATTRAGSVSLNTRNPVVLAAILKGAIATESPSSAVTNTNTTTGNAITAGNSIVAETTLRPATSRQDVSRLGSSTVVTNPPFTASEEARETVARALAEIGQTRTWGLLIDLIAQSGRYPPNAASGPNVANPLANFVVDGEKRYWLHIAIDRFTGEVIDQQLEAVYE